MKIEWEEIMLKEKIILHFANAFIRLYDIESLPLLLTKLFVIYKFFFIWQMFYHSPTLSRRGTSPERGAEEGESSLIYRWTLIVDKFILFEMISFRVLMLGSRDVGKSAICSQVLSSENRNTYDDAEGNKKMKFFSYSIYPSIGPVI